MALTETNARDSMGAHGTQDVRNLQLMRPVQVASKWMTALAAGAIDDITSETATRPDQMTDADHSLIKVNGSGTLACVRLKYDDGITGVTDPVVACFGRNSGSSSDTPQPWQRLPNKAGSNTVTMTTDLTNDVADGTYKYTTPSATNHWIDLMGCDEILFLVVTALAATGDVATAELEVKII